MRAGAFAHAVDLQDGHVEAHEVVERVFGDGRRAGEADFAAVQTERSAHLLEHQTVGHGVAPRHHVISATQKERKEGKEK